MMGHIIAMGLAVVAFVLVRIFSVLYIQRAKSQSLEQSIETDKDQSVHEPIDHRDEASKSHALMAS